MRVHMEGTKEVGLIKGVVYELGEYIGTNGICHIFKTGQKDEKGRSYCNYINQSDIIEIRNQIKNIKVK